MQISQLDYSSYLGVIGVGRITRGSVKPNQQVTIQLLMVVYITPKLVKYLVTWD